MPSRAAHSRTRARGSAASRRHVAVFPGSFDPVTYGHLDVIARGRALFDELVVAVGRNPSKDELFTQGERVSMMRELVAALVKAHPDAAPVRVEAFEGLTVDFARARGATALLRGIRNLSDLQNEVQQALTNREIAGIETAFVVAGQSFAYTSSSLIKQLTVMGRDLRALRTMVPPLVARALAAKKREGHPALARLLSQRDVAEG
ncbi:MAG: pantetheine-phosphate adenylyltransferase [Phycisphaerae bacterium]|nr:pantetheine-phosphate adenylyltransferase [Phycisphaerae bacterium]